MEDGAVHVQHHRGKKIKQNKILPYPVSNIIEGLEVDPEDEEEIEGPTWTWTVSGKARVWKSRPLPGNTNF